MLARAQRKRPIAVARRFPFGVSSRSCGDAHAARIRPRRHRLVGRAVATGCDVARLARRGRSVRRTRREVGRRQARDDRERLPACDVDAGAGRSVGRHRSRHLEGTDGARGAADGACADRRQELRRWRTAGATRSRIPVARRTRGDDGGSSSIPLRVLRVPADARALPVAAVGADANGPRRGPLATARRTRRFWVPRARGRRRIAETRGPRRGLRRPAARVPVVRVAQRLPQGDRTRALHVAGVRMRRGRVACRTRAPRRAVAGDPRRDRLLVPRDDRNGRQRALRSLASRPSFRDAGQLREADSVPAGGESRPRAGADHRVERHVPLVPHVDAVPRRRCQPRPSVARSAAHVSDACAVDAREPADDAPEDRGARRRAQRDRAVRGGGVRTCDPELRQRLRHRRRQRGEPATMEGARRLRPRALCSDRRLLVAEQPQDRARGRQLHPPCHRQTRRPDLRPRARARERMGDALLPETAPVLRTHGIRLPRARRQLPG